MPPATPRPPTPRAAKQLLAGLIPLLVIGLALCATLTVLALDLRAEVRRATETADATVTATGEVDNGTAVDVTWTDERGEHTATVTYPDVRELPAGALVTIAYEPVSEREVSRVYAAGDLTLTRLVNLAYGAFLAGLVTLAAAVTTGVRWARRRRLPGRPGQTVRVRRVQVRNKLVVRSWLVIAGTTETWAPMYWEPVVETIGDRGADLTVHGDQKRDRLLGFAKDGHEIWPSGRIRTRPPKGIQSEGPTGVEGSVSIGRQFRADGAILIAAPLLGLLWAYLDGTGAAGFWLSTVLFAGVLTCIPSVYGSDPT